MRKYIFCERKGRKINVKIVKKRKVYSVRDVKNSFSDRMENEIFFFLYFLG